MHILIIWLTGRIIVDAPLTLILPQGHPVITSAREPILVVTLPKVADAFKGVINKKTYGTDSKLVNLLNTHNVNLTHKDLNTSIEEPENRWIIHLVWYDTGQSKVEPSSYSQLSYFSWSFGIFGMSHW